MYKFACQALVILWLYYGLLCSVDASVRWSKIYLNARTTAPRQTIFFTNCKVASWSRPMYSRPKMSGTSYLISKPLSAITGARVRGE